MRLLLIKIVLNSIVENQLLLMLFVVHILLVVGFPYFLCSLVRAFIPFGHDFARHRPHARIPENGSPNAPPYKPTKDQPTSIGKYEFRIHQWKTSGNDANPRGKEAFGCGWESKRLGILGKKEKASVVFAGEARFPKDDCLKTSDCRKRSEHP
jgi:hypothetical protein